MLILKNEKDASSVILRGVSCRLVNNLICLAKLSQFDPSGFI